MKSKRKAYAAKTDQSDDEEKMSDEKDSSDEDEFMLMEQTV